MSAIRANYTWILTIPGIIIVILSRSYFVKLRKSSPSEPDKKGQELAGAIITLGDSVS